MPTAIQTPNRAPQHPQSLELGPGRLLARALPETFDEERGTVQVVWSTGARVRRYDWRRDEEYWEELSLDPSHVHLDRLNKGAPVVDSHRTWGIDSVLGVVERAWVEKGKGLAEIRFDLGGETGREAARKTKDGILRNWSIGYDVARGGWEETPPQREGELRVRRAVDWTVYELSLVPIGADEDAQTRAQERGKHVALIETAGGPDIMPQQEQRTQGGGAPAAGAVENQQPTPAATERAPAATPSQAEVTDQVERAVRAEAARASEIRRLCRKHGFSGTEFEETLLAPGVTLDSARSQILDKLAATGESTSVRGQVRIGAESVDLRRAAVVNALEHRLMPAKVELSPEGRDFRGMGLLEVGRNLLEARGIRTRGLSKMELAGAILGRAPGYVGTSDLASVLSNVGSKVLRVEYAEAPNSFSDWVGEQQLSDFKQTDMVRLSDAPALQELTQTGEFALGAMSDEVERIQAKVHGVIVPITRTAIVNDDLGAIDSLTRKLARRARHLEADKVYSVLTANAALVDGVALFHATHGNLGSGPIGDAAISAGKAGMRKQKDLQGSKLDIRPAFWIGPVALENEATKYLSQNIVPAKAADTNPHRGTLQVRADPRLDDTSAVIWFLAAAPKDAPLVVIGYVDGQRGPVFEEEMGFQVDGIAFKVRHDFAAAAAEYRGGWKSTGV